MVPTTFPSGSSDRSEGVCSAAKNRREDRPMSKSPSLDRTRTLERAGGLAVPPLCFGTSSLGNMPGTYGYEVDEARARETIDVILDSPFPFIDTSRNYGGGESERRIGAALAERGGLPAGALLSTKLDRDPDTGRFDAARARRSLEESLGALGLDHVDILHLHDPEHAASLQEIVGPDGALPTLVRMKEEGLCRAIGLAAGDVTVMMPILLDWDFDVLITHNRWTLSNRNAGQLIETALSRGVAVMNAAPYAGGVFAKGSVEHPRYVYQEADESTLDPIREIEDICARHGVPVGAVALQFSLRDPRVAATVCGVTKPERVDQTLAWAALDVPDAVWAEIGDLDVSSDDPEATRTWTPD